MTSRVRTPLLCFVLAFALSSVVAFGCADGGSSGGSGGSGGSGSAPDGSVFTSCFALQPPPEQPHLSSAPMFASSAVFPTFPVEAEVGVDAETRTMKVQLQDAIFRDDPPAGTVERQVNGAQTFSLTFPTDERTEAFFFMEITLCADDCNEQRFVYTFEGDFPRTYERVVFEGNSEVERRETCIEISTVLVD